MRSKEFQSLQPVAIEPYFHPEWLSGLKKCRKNGGYKSFCGRHYWSHNSIPYFNIANKIYGGIPNLTTSASIKILKEIDYFPEAIEGNNVSKFTFSIKKNRTRKFEIESGFAFNLSGANLFQHFIQDCLPILAASKEFLNSNPDLSILMPKFTYGSNIRDSILKSLNIYNKIVETNSDSISIRNLYYWHFEPFPAKYSLPDYFYNILQKELEHLYITKPSIKMILVTRKEKHRSFANEKEIIEKCNAIAQEQNLELIVINSSVASYKDWETHMPEAKVVIGMHGGALFNLILCKPGTQLYEFVPTIGTDSVINTFTKLGIKVVPIPIQCSKNQLQPINIPVRVLGEIGNIIRNLS